MSSNVGLDVERRRPSGLSPKQLERYAEVMAWALNESRRKGPAKRACKPGEIIQLCYQPKALCLIECLYPLLLSRGYIVALDPLPNSRLERALCQFGSQAQLDFSPPWRNKLLDRANGLIYVEAPESLTHLKDCDPDKVRASRRWTSVVREVSFKREKAGLYAWTVCLMPTAALAKQSGMSFGEYSQEVARACYLNETDPVARWQDTMAKSERVKRWLDELDIEWVQVRSDDGETDLKVWVGPERQWVRCDGCNVPSFEVFVSPQAGRAEGHFHANGVSFRCGQRVSGVRLEFRGGEVTKASAVEGEQVTRATVASDEGSKRIGEFSLTDRRFSEITRFMASMLYDENVGGSHGNCHIALGSAYADSYAGSEPLSSEREVELGFNQSAVHWDLVTTSPRQVVARLKSGRELLIYADGQFTLPL